MQNETFVSSQPQRKKKLKLVLCDVPLWCKLYRSAGNFSAVFREPFSYLTDPTDASLVAQIDEEFKLSMPKHQTSKWDDSVSWSCR